LCLTIGFLFRVPCLKYDLCIILSPFILSLLSTTCLFLVGLNRYRFCIPFPLTSFVDFEKSLYAGAMLLCAASEHNTHISEEYAHILAVILIVSPMSENCGL